MCSHACTLQQDRAAQRAPALSPSACQWTHNTVAKGKSHVQACLCACKRRGQRIDEATWERMQSQRAQREAEKKAKADAAQRALEVCIVAAAYKGHQVLWHALQSMQTEGVHMGMHAHMCALRSCSLPGPQSNMPHP